MNDETAEQMPTTSRRQPLSLSSLYLDPNNFRFVDHPDYPFVPPERVFDAERSATHDQHRAGPPTGKR